MELLTADMVSSHNYGKVHWNESHVGTVAPAFAWSVSDLQSL